MFDIEAYMKKLMSRVIPLLILAILIFLFGLHLVHANAESTSRGWPWSDTVPGNMYEHGGFRNDCESLPRKPCGESLRDPNTGRRFYGPAPDSDK